METKAHYTLIGAFALAVMLAAVGFVLWIAKAQFDQEFDTYTVRFSEAVSGLAKGAAVQFHGIQVGEVRNLRLDPEDTRHVLALVRVTGGTPIKTDTSAKLTYQGITGVAVVQLFGGEPGSPLLKLVQNTAAPLIIAESSDLDRLMSGSADVMTSFHDALIRVSSLLNEENLQHVSQSLANIETLTAQLSQDNSRLGDMFGSVDAAAVEVRATAAELKQVLRKVDGWIGASPSADSVALSEVIAEAQRALAALEQLTGTLAETVGENRDALRRFAGAALPAATQSLQELPALLRRLERVLAAFAQQPREALFGGGKGKELEAK